jgi:predicted nucleic acid-binding protein
VPDVASLVVDASVLVNAVLGSASRTAVRLRDAELHAPAHLDLEVLSAVARLRRGGRITERAARKGLDRLQAAPVVRHSLVDLVDEAWARRENVRVADGLYVALAERLGLPLVTADHRLARVYGSAELLGP